MTTEQEPNVMAETETNPDVFLFLRRQMLAFSPEDPTSPENCVQCHWCYDNFALSGTPIKIDCGHVFCRQCLNACFRTALSSRRSFPPMCCTSPISFDAILDHLDDAVALRYTQKQAEYSVRDPTWCSHKPCSKLFSQAQIDDARPNNAVKFMTCIECKHETCFQCKQPRDSHSGPRTTRCPRQGGITKEDRALAHGEKWKLCPNSQCSVLIQKSEACDHMICSECGTDFCYRCGTLMYDRRYHLPKCWRYRVYNQIKYFLCFR